MQQEFSRAALLLGEAGMERLARAHVAVFGVGGVGAAAAEALARGGVGAITLVDSDAVSVSNRNRQLIALASTVGQPKVQVMAARIRDINPACQVTPLQLFVTPEAAPGLSGFDYVVDAIDTVTAKLWLIETCDRLGVPLICSMGTGNKLDPTRFQVADIYKTSVCPLARVIRQECKSGISGASRWSFRPRSRPRSRRSAMRSARVSPRARPAGRCPPASRLCRRSPASSSRARSSRI